MARPKVVATTKCVAYGQTELHLENSCLKNARRALHDSNKPLRRGKGGLLFAYDAAMAFQILFCLTIIP